MIHDALAQLVAGQDLEERVAAEVMDALFGQSLSAAQAAAVITALRIKGATVTELCAGARAVRSHAARSDAIDGVALDTCGTGGARARTFNARSAASVVVAACGVTVARHGRRAAAGRGVASADVLAALGVKVDAPRDIVARCVREVGIGFLYAPSAQAVLDRLLWLRTELRFPSMLELLSPLANPAGATFQLIGVENPRHARTLAEVVGRLGTRRAWVVSGSNGLDEISASGPTQVVSLRSGVLIESTVVPDDFGLDAVDAASTAGGDVVANAAAARGVIEGERGPRRTAVLLNAAAGLVVAEVTNDLRAAAELAAEAIDSGRARSTLERWIVTSHGAL